MPIGGAVIGALRVLLSADSAAFETGLKGAQSSLAKFAKGLKSPAVLLGAGITAIVGTALTGTKLAINRIDELNQAAQKFGVPVKELSALKYAADLADVSLDTLGTGLKFLSKNMVEAAQNTKSQAAKAFQQLGIEVKNSDGTLKSSQQVLIELSDKFKNMQDGALKTALAIKIFGRSGTEMIPLLNEGTASIQSMVEEAAKLGIVIDENTAKAADRFNDNLTKLQTAFSGLFIQIASNLTPTLVELTDKIVAWVAEGNAAKNITDSIEAAIQFLNQALINATAGWEVLVRAVQAAKTVLSTNIFEPGKMKAEIEDAAADIKAIWAKAAADIQSSMQKVNASAKGDLGPPRKTTSDDDDTDLQDDAAASAAAAKEIENSVRDAQRSWNQLVSEGQQVFEATRTPAEALQAEIQRLNVLLNRGVIDWDTYNRAVKQAQDTFDGASNLAEDMGNAIEDSLGGLFDDLIDGSANFKESLIDLGKELTKLALNNALKGLIGGLGGGASGGGGLGGFLAGLFGGKGFAQGGAFKVGGYGGIDSQLRMIRASPRETVQIHKPGEFGNARGGNVTIIDQRQNAPQVERSEDGNGNQTFLIRDMLKNELPTALKPVMAQQYGITPRINRR